MPLKLPCARFDSADSPTHSRVRRGLECLGAPVYDAAGLDRSLLSALGKPEWDDFSSIHRLWDSLCGSRQRAPESP